MNQRTWSRGARREVCAVFAMVAGVACDPPHAAPSASRAEERAAAVAAVEPGVVVLDRGDDGAVLAGRLEPARAESDGDRVVVLGAAAPADLAGARVLDARFVSAAVVTLGVDRVLRLHPGGGAPVVELDRDAHAPLAVARDAVAYARGAPPDVEIAQVDVRTRAARALTRGMAPAWSPALAPDAREVVFVSSVAGTPRLYRRDGAGAITALPPTARTPSAPTAPRWLGETLVFEDEAGVAWVDLARGAVVRDAPGARGLAVLGDGAVVATVDGRPRVLAAARGAR